MAAGLAVVALLGTSCGDDSDNPASTGTPDSTAPATTAHDGEHNGDMASSSA